MNQFDQGRAFMGLLSNPAYAKDYFSRQEEERKRAYELQQQQQYANATKQALGNANTAPSKYGSIMGIGNNPITNNGSGLIGATNDPQQRALLEYQKQILNGGKIGIDAQVDAHKNYQNSLMSNIGAMQRHEPRAETTLEFFKRDPQGYAKMKSLDKPLVSVNNGGLGVEEQMRLEDYKERSKYNRERITNIKNVGQSSSQELEKTNEMMRLLEANTPVGQGQDYLVQAKQVLTMFGVKYPELADQEKLQTLMGDLVMARVAQTKGAVSEKEMDLFKQYSANFGKSKDGNLAILDMMRQKQSRDALIWKEVRKLEALGATNQDIVNKIDDIVDSNPIKPMTFGNSNAGKAYSDPEKQKAWEAFNKARNENRVIRR